MTHHDWRAIARYDALSPIFGGLTMCRDICKHYDDYNAFIVLHGTDTMAYTASILSFMLQHLAKTVIVTGSQIPLSEVRNDAQANLQGALVVAGHYEIPEVCLYVLSIRTIAL